MKDFLLIGTILVLVLGFFAEAILNGGSLPWDALTALLGVWAFIALLFSIPLLLSLPEWLKERKFKGVFGIEVCPNLDPYFPIIAAILDYKAMADKYAREFQKEPDRLSKAWKVAEKNIGQSQNFFWYLERNKETFPNLLERIRREKGEKKFLGLDEEERQRLAARP